MINKKKENKNALDKKEYTVDGLRNSMHFLADQPAICIDENLLNEVLSWKIDLNHKDINGNTPVFIQINQ